MGVDKLSQVGKLGIVYAVRRKISTFFISLYDKNKKLLTISSKFTQFLATRAVLLWRLILNAREKVLLQFYFLYKINQLLNRYSTQLIVTLFVAVFLISSVGQGQAYSSEDESAYLLDELALSTQDGFISKPQLFMGQTILTGEVQESVAIIYRVEPGDSITSIAKRYELSPGSIIDANNMDLRKIEKIEPGTELLIPANDTNTSMAWLDEINRIKEEERQRAIREEQRRLAQLRRQRQEANTSRYSRVVSGKYEIIGTFKFGYNGGVSGQCTNWVLEKRKDLPRQMGNGGQYLASAKRYGLPTGKTPRVGAVIVTSESAWGHVGIVEAVGDDTVTISEMNYVRPFVASRRTIPINAWFIKGYVY